MERGVFSEITEDRNKKGKNLSTEEPLDPDTTGWEGRGKDSTLQTTDVIRNHDLLIN